MSKLIKGVKKHFKNVAKVVKKVVKSKIFKVALMAAAVYFGGAALISMANGGTAMAGIGSAWSGVTGAGSALASGQFSAAGSSISAGWSGAATGAQSFAAGKAATTAITSAATAPAATVTAATTSSGVGAATPELAAMHPATASASMTPTAASSLPSGGLLSGAWNGLGEAGKAALITSGVNMGGQMIAGHSAQKAEQERENDFRKRQTYWGVDGDGNGDTSGNQFKGLLQLAQVTPMASGRAGTAPWNNPTPQPGVTTTPQASYQPKTLDELIKMMG